MSWLFFTVAWLTILTAVSSPRSLGAGLVDTRNFASGYPIPDEDYCDQPRVVVTKDGTWVCVLTTGPGHEGGKGQHVVATSTSDQGRTWSPLVDIEPGSELRSAYAIALITPSDRIYAIYCYNGDGISALPDGKPIRDDMQGWCCYRFSDDKGKTWSGRQRIPMRLTAVDRNNEWGGKLQMWWAIGTPTVFGNSAVFGFTKLAGYILQGGEGWFYRSDNVLTEQDPSKIVWQLVPEGDHGVRLPEFGSVQEEFDVVHLEENTLFCVFRTTLGHAGSSYSRDGGKSWEKPDALRYRPGGRVVKQSRACTKIWKTKGGRYLLWYHNNGTKSYNNGPNVGSRNIAWLTAGTPKEGRLYWSEPEIVTYVDGGLEGCSYPDLIEAEGKFYIVSTQKTEARLQEVNADLLAGLFSQDTVSQAATEGLAAEAKDISPGTKVAAPKFKPFGSFSPDRTASFKDRGGLTIELVVRFNDLAPGQALLENLDGTGKGFALRTTRGALDFDLCDGWRAAHWECDSGLLSTNKSHHIVVIVDGGPKTISYVIDGVLCDGGKDRLFGFGRFDPAFKDVSAAKSITLAPQLSGKISAFRVYDRALRTSEAVGNFRAQKL